MNVHEVHNGWRLELVDCDGCRPHESIVKEWGPTLVYGNIKDLQAAIPQLLDPKKWNDLVKK